MKNWACNLGVTVRSSRTSYLSLFGVVSCRTFLISHFPDFSMFQNTSQHRIVEFTRKNCLLIISRQAYAFRSVDIQHFLKKFNKKISFGHCSNLTKTEWSLLCWISSNIFVEISRKCCVNCPRGGLECTEEGRLVLRSFCPCRFPGSLLSCVKLRKDSWIVLRVIRIL